MQEYTCVCKHGYEGDGIENCSDIDECQNPDICSSYGGPERVECQNIIGDYYSCECKPGYYKYTTFGNECLD